MSLEIKRVATKKHNVYQRPLMEEKIIPHHPSISIFSGSQGSGKSTLVNNLLNNPIMFKGYFDAIFLLIGSDDDMYDDAIEKGVINKDHVIKLPEPADIQKIIDMQKLAIENSEDISKAPKILVIFDDVANNGKLLRSKPFLQLFVAGRHLNSSTWFLSQYLNLVPKNCRLQANYLFCFKMNRAEMNILCDQFNPPDITKKEFCRMILDVTTDTENSNGSKKINFLLIVKGVDSGKRFRRNLDEYIVLGDTELKKKDTVVQHHFSSDDEPETEVKLNINNSSKKPDAADALDRGANVVQTKANLKQHPVGRRPLLFSR